MQLRADYPVCPSLNVGVGCVYGQNRSHRGPRRSSRRILPSVEGNRRVKRRRQERGTQVSAGPDRRKTDQDRLGVKSCARTCDRATHLARTRQLTSQASVRRSLDAAEQQGQQAPPPVQGRPYRHARRCDRCRHRSAPDGCHRRLRRLRLHVGRGRPVRVRRQLVHQHRQRLLRRSAVLAVQLGRHAAVRSTRPAPTWPARPSRSRSPRSSSTCRDRAPGPAPVPAT